MAGNPRVLGLLEEMLYSGRTPEEVCRDCPELLAEVRQRLQAFHRIDAEVEVLIPDPGSLPAGDANTPEPPPAGLPQVPGYEVEAVLGQGLLVPKQLRLQQALRIAAARPAGPV